MHVCGTMRNDPSEFGKKALAQEQYPPCSYRAPRRTPLAEKHGLVALAATTLTDVVAVVEAFSWLHLVLKGSVEMLPFTRKTSVDDYFQMTQREEKDKEIKTLIIKRFVNGRE